MSATAPTPLLVRFGRLGDMVLQAPLLQLLCRRYGRACRLLSAGPWSTPLFAADANVAEIWQLRSRHTPFLVSPERWRLVRALRRHDGPVYVSEDIAEQVARIRRLFALAGVAPERCVFLDDGAAGSQHWVDRLLELGRRTPPAFRAADFPSDARDAVAAPRLRLRAADRVDRDRWLLARGLAGQALVLLQPGNKHALKRGRPRRSDPKAWPAARWAALMRAIVGAMPDARLLLCGSPAEQGLLAGLRVAAGVPNIEVVADELPLRRLMALLEIAHSMVSIDTGPAHVAAAIGCPLVVLYGAESPRVWGRRSPCGSPVVEIGGPPAASVSEIDVDEVIAAWSSLADAAQPAAALA